MAHHRVTLITTGGTIDKIYPPDKGSYAFVFGEEPASKAILARARMEVEEIIRIPPKDSLDMTDDDRERIADACEIAVPGSVVITHGTDTMIETAAAIAKRNIGKAIVLVGSAQPEGMKETDADFNLGFAFGCAQALPTAGVFIAMNGEVFRWNKCEKGEDGIFRHIA